MNIILHIPKEFEEHYNKDRFKDTLERINIDVRSLKFTGLSGQYELETLEMLITALSRSFTSSHAAKLVMNSVYGKGAICVGADNIEYLEEDEELLIDKARFEKFNKECKKEGDNKRQQ